jgi:E3 ubiquitin-protein ligase HUWE1
VLKQGLLHLNEVLKQLEPLHTPVNTRNTEIANPDVAHQVPEPGGSVLLRELVSSPSIPEATANPSATPLLHHMSAAHAYIQMFVHVCRTGQADIRTISVSHWGSELGLAVLAGLSKLYTSLVWESTVLLALCRWPFVYLRICKCVFAARTHCRPTASSGGQTWSGSCRPTRRHPRLPAMAPGRPNLGP